MLSIPRRGTLTVKATTPSLMLVFAACLCLWAAGIGSPRAQAAEKLRVLVLTDIGNEPDDAQSMIRFLLYTNEFDVEGLVVTTSTWQRKVVSPEKIRVRVEAYGKVRNNLLVHAKGYPETERLLSLIKTGRPEYGMNGVGEGKDTEGSEWIISVVDKPDPRPVWITVWGGAADLAQALWKVKQTRSRAEVAAFTKKIRAYAISDQDDTGPRIRRNFPKLFYIVSIHAFSKYALSTWCGISGERLYKFKGPDFSLVSNDWLDRHVRKGHGPMGELYPWTAYIMEGDTPSFLYLIPNGLGVPERPSYGSWGGRYEKAEQGAGLYADTLDTVRGADGEWYTSNQATVWRWREAYQNDFAARMDWSATGSYEDANHHPVVVLNGKEGKNPLKIAARSGQAVELGAAGSTDPDGDRLSYRWFQYSEAGGGGQPTVEISNPTSPKITFTAPEVRTPRPVHMILTVTDNGTPNLTSYRRAVVTVNPK